MPAVKKTVKRTPAKRKAPARKTKQPENAAIALLQAIGRGIFMILVAIGNGLMALSLATGRGVAATLRYINARPRLRLASIIALVTAIVVPSYIWADREGHVDQAIVTTNQAIHDSLIAMGFKIDDVTVTGRVRTGKDDLLTALDVNRGQSILHLDLDDIRGRVTGLEWVQDVRIGRHLPDRVHVELIEREPFAVWQKDGRLYLIDRGGIVITAADVRSFDHLPLVVGKGANEQAARLYDTVLTRNELKHRVEAAIRVGARRWDLRLDNGIEVRLPADDPQAAWNRLADLEADHNILTRDIEVIDLRLPDRLVVRLTDEAAQRRLEPGEET